MSRPIAISYVPPVGKGHPHAFLANLKRFPATSMPLLLFSDVPEQHAHFGFEMFKMRASPEVAQAEGGPMWPAVSNMAFLSACILAHRRGFTHILYLEEDCRVVEGWADKIWSEYLAAKKPDAVAGSIVIYHSHAMHGRAVKDANALKEKNWARNVPVAEYGKPTSEQPHKPSVFPNGALGIYPLNVMDNIFHFTQGGTVALAQSIAAYDHYIGWQLYAEHGDNIFDRAVQLNSVYSTYKDQVVTTEQRQVWLTERKFVAIHPVKTDWVGPEILERVAELADASDRGCDVSDSAPSRGNAGSSPAPLTISDALQRPTPIAKSEKVIGEPLPVATVDTSDSLRMDILMVSFHKDAQWVVHALRSIEKFATGFGEFVIVIPTADVPVFTPIIEHARKTAKMPLRIVHGDEPEGKGHLWHNLQKMTADLHCPNADIILHFDSDLIFFQPVSPADYLEDGKPILLIEPYELLKTEHTGRYAWKAIVDATLKIDASHETMCAHGMSFWRGMYPLVRNRVEEVHSKPFEQWVLEQKPTRPCTICEFNTLGAYAMSSRYFKTKYRFRDVSKEGHPSNPKIYQFWGFGPMDAEQTIWLGGKTLKVIPSKLIQEVLG